MLIDCYFTHQSCRNSHFSGRVAIVIDVLRATSSMITAFEAGAEAIIPVAEIPDALALQAQLPIAVLTGERDGDRLEGFDLGNSPLEFTEQAVGGRLIIACTTNGTAAIQKARAAEQVWLGSLLNARAVAQQALKQQLNALAIVCAGTDSSPSLDDTMAAGAIMHYLSQEVSLSAENMNDAAQMALRLYQSYADTDMYQVLAGCRHGRKLIRFGRGHDVRYCAQQNISALVPWLDKQSSADWPRLRKGNNTP